MILLGRPKSSIDPKVFWAKAIVSGGLKVLCLYAEGQSPLMLILVFIATFCSDESEQ